MQHGIHFISGLPRSGSTLLAALLRQNPAFHAHMTSPVLTMLNAAYAAMGAQSEMSVFIDDDQREEVMRSIIEAYYHKIHPHKTVFDTNRGWTARMPMLSKMFPDAKVICCVRDSAWVIDSFERQVIRSPFTMSRMFNLDNGSSVYARAGALGGLGGTVGYAWHALREACFGNHANRLIIIDYEALTREPEATMIYVYNCLGIKPFKHDFENVEYNAAEEFDSRLGSPGLHTVRQKVSFVERRSILPPDLFRRHAGDDFWKTPEFATLGIKMRLWKH